MPRTPPGATGIGQVASGERVEAPDPSRHALSCAADAVASSGGSDIFETLVLGAARALDVDLALVGVLAEGNPERVRTIAACDRGQILPSFDYALPGTPCEDVMGQCFRYYPSGIQDLFPDPHLREVGAVGYSAIPLFDSGARSVGIMALVDRKPLTDRGLTEWVLKIFSVRAAVELERRTANEAWRRSEETCRSLFEAAEDALFVHDAETGAILDVNPKACQVYGYTREELLAADIGALSSGVAPYTLEHAARLIDRARRVGPVYMEWHRRNRDGSLHWDEVYIKSVKIGGAERILAVTREIDERKRAEAERLRLESQLRQAQKMEAIGQLTGGIAHDFNNILTGILGYLAMAQERAELLGDPRLARYLGRAEGGGQRAKELIRQMLTFSRGQRGEPRPLALGEHLGEAVKLFAATLPSTVEIRTRIAPEVPVVLLDPLHLEQILMNLCINARDAMGGKGTLEIALADVRGEGFVCASCHQGVAGAFAELAVADSGPGMAPEIAERIFEPFFSTKEPGEGSGMGLAMVHGMVHEHGGHILVDSAPGQGTRVRIRLPARLPADTRTTEQGAAQTRLAAPRAPAELCGRVLLAEDERSVRELMDDLLGSWGLDVVPVDNGVEALARFAQDPGGFDLAILDQTMPRMTGLEAAERLLALRPGLPVVLYTGYSEHVSEALARAAGVRVLLRKPLDIPAFRGELGRCLCASGEIRCDGTPSSPDGRASPGWRSV